MNKEEIGNSSQYHAKSYSRSAFPFTLSVIFFLYFENTKKAASLFFVVKEEKTAK